MWCLQDGRLFSTGTTYLAVEKDFYKLDALTRDDIALIKMLFDTGHPYSKRNHAKLLNDLMLPFQIAERIKDPKHREKMNEFLDGYTSDVLEDHHAQIEATFIPILESALNGDISFYRDERAIPFLHYLSTQFMRTKGIKERSIEACRADGSADLSRVWNVLIHMFATNIGADLYRCRRRRKLVLIHNQTEVPFITGDQPAINLKGTRPHPPKCLSIYYPLSPTLALLLADLDEEPLFPSDLTSAQASTLNEQIFKASYRQVFGKSRKSLELFLREGDA